MSSKLDLEYEQKPDGIAFGIIAKPGSRVNELAGFHDGCLRVRITAAPEKGKANKAIIALLSKKLKISKSSLQIISGETSSRKKIIAKGIASDKLLAVLGK
jgi:hypothetical protein